MLDKESDRSRLSRPIHVFELKYLGRANRGTEQWTNGLQRTGFLLDRKKLPRSSLAGIATRRLFDRSSRVGETEATCPVALDNAFGLNSSRLRQLQPPFCA